MQKEVCVEALQKEWFTFNLECRPRDKGCVNIIYRGGSVKRLFGSHNNNNFEERYFFLDIIWRSCMSQDTINWPRNRGICRTNSQPLYEESINKYCQVYSQPTAYSACIEENLSFDENLVSNVTFDVNSSHPYIPLQNAPL